MTGKYIEFKKGDTIIKAKRKMCAYLKINGYRMEVLLAGRRSGSFTWEGEQWTFETIYANPEPRGYVPNVQGINGRNSQAHTTYTVRNGNIEMTYSRVSGRLMNTKFLTN